MLDDNMEDMVPAILEVLADTDITDILGEFGFMLVNDYEATHLSRIGRRPTTLYRVYAPRDSRPRHEAVYRLWPDGEVQLMDNPEDVSGFEL